MPVSFFDTNVLACLASSDAAKADRAEAVIAAGGSISVQVLNELANVARRKMQMDWNETHALLDMLRRLLAVHPLTTDIHETGLRLAERYGFSILRCDRLCRPRRLRHPVVGGYAARPGAG
jgi:predicted nucleic acid-binding protein